MSFSYIIQNRLQWLKSLPVLNPKKCSNGFGPDEIIKFWPDFQTLAISNETVNSFGENDKHKDFRLGIQFEKLLAFWIKQQSQTQLLAHNFIIMDNKRTVGAIDFLIYHPDKPFILHWEVACKFYLGISTMHPTMTWIGPELKDSLNRKMNHMQNHQMPMGQNDLIKKHLLSKGFSLPVRSVSTIWGRVFYPVNQKRLDDNLCPNHHTGIWLTVEQALHENHKSRHASKWHLTEKNALLAPGASPSSQEILIANDQISRPSTAFRAHKSNLEWAFIVPDDWPERAKNVVANKLLD